MRRGTRVFGATLCGALTIVTLSIAGGGAAAAAEAVRAATSTKTALSSVDDAEDGMLRVKEMPEKAPNLRDLAPGDRTQWAAEVTNIGEPGMLSVEFVADGPENLMAGEESGMRMTVDLCTTPLVPVISASGAMTFECASGPTRLGIVTAATDQRLTTLSTINTGETVGVRVMILFPASATNSAEDAAAAMNVVFAIAPTDAGDGAAEPPGTAAPTDTQPERPTLFSGLALTGTGAMFLSVAASAIIALGILLLALAPRRARPEEDEAR